MATDPQAVQNVSVRTRLFSIDVFRGLTMLLMIFANGLDMAMIQGVPWYLKHARFSQRDPNFITFVDMIAPAFLFIVGMSIPFAIRSRTDRGQSGIRIWMHILTRTASLIAGSLFMEGSPAGTPRKRIVWILLFALGLLVAGFLLRPLYGLSKSGNTPTCTLYSSAASCVVFAFLYWLTDVRGWRGWVAFTQPAGRNPLVAYFLSFMLHPLTLVLGIGWLNNYLNSGVVGILRTAAVTGILGVFLTAWLSRLHVRVRL